MQVKNFNLQRIYLSCFTTYLAEFGGKPAYSAAIFTHSFLRWKAQTGLSADRLAQTAGSRI